MERNDARIAYRHPRTGKHCLFRARKEVIEAVREAADMAGSGPSAFVAAAIRKNPRLDPRVAVAEEALLVFRRRK